MNPGEFVDPYDDLAAEAITALVKNRNKTGWKIVIGYWIVFFVFSFVIRRSSPLNAAFDIFQILFWPTLLVVLVANWRRRRYAGEQARLLTDQRS